jgi:hypothetical protein
MPMTGRAALFMVAVAVGACQGDKSVRVDFSDTPRNYFSTDYGEAFVRWTRHEFVLREVEKALEVWATYKSWDFPRSVRRALRVDLQPFGRRQIDAAQRAARRLSKGVRVSRDRPERELQMERSG